MKTTLKLFAAALLLAAVSRAPAEVHYVDVNSTNATPPYTNWATAATNIQDAVDAAVVGDEVVVTNGIYASGGGTNGFPLSGDTFSRVEVDKPLNLRSVNGPPFTTIVGASAGSGSLRCVYLTNGATLSGFTLTGGVSLDEGAGVWCAASNAVVSDCVISGNQAWTYYGDACGGGAYGGTLNNCTLVGNSVHYVNSDFNWYVSTVCGGGAAYCTLNHCTVSVNSAAFDGGPAFGDAFAAEGGGAAWCMLNNCTLAGNSARVFFGPYHPTEFVAGGGAFRCTLNSCTVAGNSAAGDGGGGIYGGGTYECALNNCINFGNRQTERSPFPPYQYSLVCEDCGWDPLFVGTNGWADLRLQSNSPCINAGNNSYVTNATDLDGNPRIAGGTVDIGAYEFQSPASSISYAWLQQFNLPIDPLTDAADPDGDGVDNWHEWLAGTDPTNALSSPTQLTIIPSRTNAVLTWSANAVGFTLQSTTNFGSSGVWSTNSPAPVVIGTQNVVTNPLTTVHQFFRLTH